jgi:trans-2,3-dihydro-3-hydroxyanthranilate isomerase
MVSRQFFIVDVFAEKKYAGNQLAVFTDAGLFSDAEMQRLAKEMNYSETTFVASGEKREGGYDVRIFTPEEEVPFAGHPTLGTAFIIQKEVIKHPVKEIILSVKAGQIPVHLVYHKGALDALWMKQLPPEFSQVFSPDVIAPVLSLHEHDIDDRFFIQEVSTGLPFIIVPLKSLDAVKRARVTRDEYYELINNTKAKALLVFCPESYSKENDLNVRVFADYYGIQEDPATGSANGCLAGYLVKNSYFGENRIDIRVEQGYEIGRPSLLYLRAEETQEIDIFVGGKVIMVARGEFV